MWNTAHPIPQGDVPPRKSIMALQEKKLSPEPVRTVTAAKGKNGWETIPMGRVLHWFSSAPPRTDAGRNAVVRDYRSARSQNGRRKVL
jgi:hypothetical protein